MILKLNYMLQFHLMNDIVLFQHINLMIKLHQYFIDLIFYCMHLYITCMDFPFKFTYL